MPKLQEIWTFEVCCEAAQTAVELAEDDCESRCCCFDGWRRANRMNVSEGDLKIVDSEKYF